MGIDPSMTGFGICDDGDVRVIKTDTIDGETRPAGQRRRVEFIINALEETKPGALKVYIEAPKLSAEHTNHLYEVGWLMAKVYDWAYARPDPTWVFEVSNGELLKFVLGKGVGTKTQLAIKVYKLWNVEFDKDPKHDKLFAYCFWKYGCACERGERERVEPKRRGEGRRAIRRPVRTTDAPSV